MTSRRARSTGSGQGQSLVEVALVLPLLIFVLAGTFDLGRAIYTSNTIANAARAGNRVAIVDQTVSAVRIAARQEAAGVGLVDDDITLTIECQNIGCLATVEVETGYIPATPFIDALVGSIELHATSEMPIERVHTASP